MVLSYVMGITVRPRRLTDNRPKPQNPRQERFSHMTEVRQ